MSNNIHDGFGHQQQRRLLLLIPLLALLFRSCDALRWKQSGATLGEDLAYREAARQAILQLCIKEDYPYLDCIVGPNGEPIVAGGTFGMGVAAYLINNPRRFGFSVYANCKGDHMGAVSFPMCTADQIVNPNEWPRLLVFVKIQQGNTESNDQFAYDRRFTFAEKESRRARCMARKGLAAEVYDLLRPNMEQMPIHDVAYIMQYFEGAIFSFVANSLARTMEMTIASGFVSIYREFTENGYERFRRAVERVESELFLRGRYILSIYSLMLAFTYDMWSMDVRHCDYHPGNIIMLSERMRIDRDFAKMLIKGKIMSLDDMSDYYLGASLDAFLDSPLGSRTVSVTRLHPNRMKLIDCAYSIELAGHVQEMGGRDKVECPCYNYTALRLEDSHELYTGMLLLSKVAENLAEKYNSHKSIRTVETLYTGRRTQARLSQLDQFMEDLVAAIVAIPRIVVEETPTWENCIKRSSHLFNDQDIGLSCTMEDEMNALKIGINKLSVVKKIWKDLMPPIVRNSSYEIYVPNFTLKQEPTPPPIAGIRAGKAYWLVENKKKKKKKKKEKN